MAIAETAPADSQFRTWRASLRTLLREPLLHFLLLGAAIFAVGEYRAQSAQQNDIVVDHARVAHLAET